MESYKISSARWRGQAWFCTTGLPSDIIIEVGEMSFHLHKFPLIAKSGRIKRMAEEMSESLGAGGEGLVIRIDEVPGGSETFELAAKFCYGGRIELTARNAIPLRCAAEFLEMGEEVSEGNLAMLAQEFLDDVVFHSWHDSVTALQSCGNVGPLLHVAEELGLVKVCTEAIATNALFHPSSQWQNQTPGGSVLWNGIDTGVKVVPSFRSPSSSSDWWYDDLTTLPFALFEKVISAMKAKGFSEEAIAGAVVHYAKKSVPGLGRWQEIGGSFRSNANLAIAIGTSELEKRTALENIERMLPSINTNKTILPSKFLFGMLRIGLILRANADCIANLEKRIGLQMEQATLDDLLLPNYSYSVETLYDVECVERILEYFLTKIIEEEEEDGQKNLYDDGLEPSSASPLNIVANLIDAYLAEIAPDLNLKPDKFEELARMLPDHARVLDDGLYRAIDIYLKVHPWISEGEREAVCRIMDCQKLSVEASSHAAQNERLPLRFLVQVLFFEQQRLKTVLTGDTTALCTSARFLSQGGSESARGFSSLAPYQHHPVNLIRENEALKMNMNAMNYKVNELERQCANMREEIQRMSSKSKTGGGGNLLSFPSFTSLPTKFLSKLRSQSPLRTSKNSSPSLDKKGTVPNSRIAADERPSSRSLPFVPDYRWQSHSINIQPQPQPQPPPQPRRHLRSQSS